MKRASAVKRRKKRFAPATERAPEIYRRLSKEYPDAKCALDHRNPYELIVATILSAQCTDKRVNMVTPALFKKYPDAKAMSVANPDELQEMISRGAGAIFPQGTPQPVGTRPRPA